MDHVKHWGDFASFTTAVATLAGWLPSIAALLSILWYLMRMVNEWDVFSNKVRGWFFKDEQ